MTRAVMEWIGRTPDTPIPDRVQVRVFGRDNGRCKSCARRCGIGGEAWVMDHTVALINGGGNRESNLQVLCVECHKSKTAGDVAEKSRVYQRKKTNIGIKKQSTFACARTSRWKKKINGQIVPRNPLAAG